MSGVSRSTRIVAGITAAYSLTLVFKPAVLAKPCGLLGPGGSVPDSVDVLTRSIGSRDAILAGLLLLAPDAGAARRLTVARVLADGGDAVLFGLLLRDRKAAVKVAAAAGAWAALEAGIGFLAD